MIDGTVWTVSAPRHYRSVPDCHMTIGSFCHLRTIAVCPLWHATATYYVGFGWDV